MGHRPTRTNTRRRSGTCGSHFRASVEGLRVLRESQRYRRRFATLTSSPRLKPGGFLSFPRWFTLHGRALLRKKAPRADTASPAVFQGLMQVVDLGSHSTLYRNPTTLPTRSQVARPHG